MKEAKDNIDSSSVEHFGKEWKNFKQDLRIEELEVIANRYFSLFPWDILSKDSNGFDMGCGSGRWARFVSTRVGKLTCIDPSEEALSVAKNNLEDCLNCIFEKGSANSNELEDNSMDFGYSLGVLHHVPDTLSALKNCSKKLRRGAPFLLYLYYKFDNRGLAFRILWYTSNFLRLIICNFPFRLKKVITDMIALLIYFPLAKLSYILDKTGVRVKSIPLAFYRNSSFYTMRTDSLDRFGTPLEKRFTKEEIRIMMKKAGFVKITFLEGEPYWVCLGYKG